MFVFELKTIPRGFRFLRHLTRCFPLGSPHVGPGPRAAPGPPRVRAVRASVFSNSANVFPKKTVSHVHAAAVTVSCSPQIGAPQVPPRCVSPKRLEELTVLHGGNSGRKSKDWQDSSRRRKTCPQGDGRRRTPCPGSTAGVWPSPLPAPGAAGPGWPLGTWQGRCP